MSESTLPKAYDFSSTEKRLYEWWEKSGFFKPTSDPKSPSFDPDKKTFVISIPPPNVTGELHLGHAMFVSMEDLMIRHHRMKGVPRCGFQAVIMPVLPPSFRWKKCWSRKAHPRTDWPGRIFAANLGVEGKVWRNDL